MSRVRAESFLQIDEADLSAYADARAAEIDLVIAASFRPCVLENLSALQTHARRVSAALQDLDAVPLEARQP
jgi:hypothetical protein